MHWIPKLIALLIILLCAALLFAATDYGRSNIPLQWKSGNLPMTFAHADHAGQQCVSCHHNYQDDTGQGLCLDCHRTDPEVSHLMLEQFHELCMGCHTDNRGDEQKAGPLRSCEACHTTDNRP